MGGKGRSSAAWRRLVCKNSIGKLFVNANMQMLLTSLLFPNIVSYIDELDANHSRAEELFRILGRDRVVSQLTLVELASVYSRAGLEKPLSLGYYSVKRVGARIIDVDFNKVLIEALRLAPVLGLRSLDLLHITACKLIGASVFATFDKDIISKADKIKTIGISVIVKP